MSEAHYTLAELLGYLGRQRKNTDINYQLDFSVGDAQTILVHIDILTAQLAAAEERGDRYKVGLEKIAKYEQQIRVNCLPEIMYAIEQALTDETKEQRKERQDA